MGAFYVYTATPLMTTTIEGIMMTIWVTPPHWLELSQNPIHCTVIVTPANFGDALVRTAGGGYQSYAGANCEDASSPWPGWTAGAGGCD